MNPGREGIRAGRKVVMVNKQHAGSPRYRAQFQLLEKALEGDSQGIHSVVQYLNAANPDLRRMMQATLHDCSDERLWRSMLDCLAYGCWQAFDPVTEEPTTDQVFQSISEAFVIDESESEAHAKQSVLLPALEDQDSRLRQAAGYILGLRGELGALPVLEKVIQHGDVRWKQRAIHALVILDDERCGPLLITALADPDRSIHHTAGRALSEMGRRAEPALMAALHHPDSHVRWHVARALGQIGNPHAVETLAEGLYDDNQEVRWTTARVLAYLDAPAIPAILAVLSTQPMDESLRSAAYHALHSMSPHTQAYVARLLQVLGSQSTAQQAPPIARRLLAEWQYPNAYPTRQVETRQPLP
jgi:hypothetical protein